MGPPAPVHPAVNADLPPFDKGLENRRLQSRRMGERRLFAKAQTQIDRACAEPLLDHQGARPESLRRQGGRYGAKPLLNEGLGEGELIRTQINTRQVRNDHLYPGFRKGRSRTGPEGQLPIPRRQNPTYAPITAGSDKDLDAHRFKIRRRPERLHAIAGRNQGILVRRNHAGVRVDPPDSLLGGAEERQLGARAGHQKMGRRVGPCHPYKRSCFNSARSQSSSVSIS